MKKMFLSSAILLSALFLSGAMFYADKNINEKQSISTLSKEKEGNTLFSISDISLPGNTVSFSVDYAQDDVWYWNQVKEDFIYWNWSQDNDEYFKYEGVMPTLTITHEEVWEYDPELDQDVLVNPPDPPPSTSDWEIQSYKEGDYTAEYKWTSETLKAKEPYFYNGWKIDSISDLDKNWTQKEWDEWDWSYETTASKWSNATDRAETGLGNKKAWIEWELISEGNIEQSGQEDINIYDTNTPSQEIDQRDFEETLEKQYTEYGDDNDDNFDHRSSSRPDINIPDPYDSDNGDTKGSETIIIDNLASGWDYQVNVKLKYEDPYGSTITSLDKSSEVFTVERGAPTHRITSSSDNDSSVTFAVGIEDHQSARTTPISWELKDSTDNVIDGGSFNSDYFKETFTGLSPTETYTFSIYYEYSVNSSSSETIPMKDEKTQQPNGPSESSNVLITDLSVENISNTEYILTMDIDAENNIIPSGVSAGWIVNEEKIKISELHNGTNSQIIEVNNLPEMSDITVEAYINGNSTSNNSQIQTYEINTNLTTPFGISIKNQTATNRESTISYETYGDPSQIEMIEYRINDNSWITMDKNEPELILTELDPSTEYNIEMRATGTPVNDSSEPFVNYSNHFTFTTDDDTSMYLDSSLTSQGENSASIAVTVDNYQYFDDKKITWVVEDLNSNKYIQEGEIEVKSDGPIHFTIDNLNPDTPYRIFINANIEGEVYEDHIDFSTSSKESLSQRDNAIITSAEKGKRNTFNIEYTGTAKYIEYSLTGEEGTWQRVQTTFNDDKEISLSISEDSDTFYFRLNGSANSIFTWYEGHKDTTLYVPWIPNYLVITLVSLLFVLLFAALASALAFGYHYWLKKYGGNKSRINMWKK